MTSCEKGAKKLNILLINHYAGSSEMGMEYRPTCLARHWVQMGHEVTIVAAGFSHLRQKNPEMTRAVQEVTLEGIHYLFVKTLPYQKNNGRRAVNLVQFVRGLYRLAPALVRDFRPDVVIASSTHPFDFRPAERIAKAAKAKLVFELHDLWPQSLMEIYGYAKSHPLMACIQREEDRALRRADLVVSLLPFANLYAQERGLDVKSFVHIPNGVDCPAPESMAKPPKKPMDLLRKRRDQGMFLVLYAGGFSAANALEDFVQAAGLCPSDMLFVAIGEGPMKSELKRRARADGIQNLLFLDGVSRQQLPGILELADCLYIGAKKAQIYRYGVSMNKLFDYMLAAKPIIYGVPSANNPVADAACGITIPSEDPQEIVKAARALQAKTEDERQAMGARGRGFVEKNHSYRALADLFLASLEKIGESEKPQTGGGEAR